MKEAFTSSFNWWKSILPVCCSTQSWFQIFWEFRKAATFAGYCNFLYSEEATCMHVQAWRSVRHQLPLWTGRQAVACLEFGQTTFSDYNPWNPIEIRFGELYAKQGVSKLTLATAHTVSSKSCSNINLVTVETSLSPTPALVAQVQLLNLL